MITVGNYFPGRSACSDTTQSRAPTGAGPSAYTGIYSGLVAEVDHLIGCIYR